MRPFLLLALVLLASCSRHPGVQFTLEREAFVTFELRNAGGKRHRVLDGEKLTAAEHVVAAREGKLFVDGEPRGEFPAGAWQWTAGAHGELRSAPRGAGFSGFTGGPTDVVLGGDDGTPSAVAADAAQVYLGWSGALAGTPLVAVDPDGTVQWTHRETGPCGVRALAAEKGTVFVLGHGGAASTPGSVLYKLDAKSGAPLPWEGKGERFLRIASLWPADADLQPISADALAVGNDRLYLSFTQPGFIAVLDARAGHYVTTLSAPEPGPMALSTTPLQAPDTGAMEVADFGVAVLMGRAASYFVMPHDPPWVAMNTTRRLAEDERITAFTMRAETMKSGDVQLFFGLAAPQSQVQVRPAADPSGYTFSVGKPGGREELGAWEARALRDIRSLAIDARGQLWVAEGGAWPKRFSVWTTSGKEAQLVREHFGPLDQRNTGAAVFPGDPGILIAQGCEWRIDRATGESACVGVITREGMEDARFIEESGRQILAVSTTAADGTSVRRFFERRTPGDWQTVDAPTSVLPPKNEWMLSVAGIGQVKITASPDSLTLAAVNLPIALTVPTGPQPRGLAQTQNGRVFFVTGTADPHVAEIEGLTTLRLLGSGEWPE